MGADVVLALDLGGTQVRAAGVLPGGAVAAVRRLHTPSEDGCEAIVSACIAALREVRDDLATRADLARPIGIGVSTPGPVDPGTGTVLDPPNLGPTFHDVPLAARIENALGLPVALDRDTQVAALGEGRFGAAAGCDDFVYMTVSTGVGGAIVTGGGCCAVRTGRQVSSGTSWSTCMDPCVAVGCADTSKRSRRGAGSPGEHERLRRAARASSSRSSCEPEVRLSAAATWPVRRMPATRPPSGSWRAPATPSPPRA